MQTCEQGEAAWVQIPGDGQDADELDAPAPSVAVVAADESAAGGTGGTQSVADSTSNDAADPAAGGGGPLVITSLAVGGLGLIVAVIALVRGRRQA